MKTTPKYYFLIEHTLKEENGLTRHLFAISITRYPKKQGIVKQVPPYLIKEALKAFDSSAKKRGKKFLGTITYHASGQHAQATSVFPTEHAYQQPLGVGSYIEAVTTNELKKHGIKKIDSTERLEEPRVKQLEKAFGETRIPYIKPVNEWLQGIGRRISDGRKKSKEE
ncbi:hypothetical protein HUU53_04540 [Candidatus Micrarchaeota archaeon]|nr:hypothetical protein [Candidatus Micrarchaeota archaeon]